MTAGRREGGDLPARLRRHAPPALIAVALAAALLHMAPFWTAQLQTPEGWEFTGILTGSPDAMQYRMLMDRSQEVGPVVENRLTAEPNAPHIVMVFYYGLGKLSAWLGAKPAFVYEYLGAALAVVLVLVLFWIVDHYMESRYRTWWVFLAILLGGGLGAHLRYLNQIDHLRAIGPFHRIVTEGLRNSIVFESYRNHYVFSTLFDTHFLFFLLTALAAVVALYRAVKRFSVGRALLASFCFGAVTVLHIYDGVTLLSIAAGVVFVLWLRGLEARPALVTAGLCALAVAGAIGWQMWLYRESGLPIPDWRAQSIYFSELALAYPLAWGLLAWGLGRYWESAGVDECFLLGWVLGCTLLTLSGPFYPYPDRGNLTLQVPLTLVAGAIYFAWRPRVRPRHALVAVALLGVSPIWKTGQRMEIRDYVEHHPSGEVPAYTWMSPEHRQLVRSLAEHAGERDVLVVDKTRPPWRTDDLWLTLDFPGVLYAGHYALTPEYERKREEVNAFYHEMGPSEAASFLARSRIRFVYVDPDGPVERLEAIRGLEPIRSTTAGTLLEVRPGEVP